MRNRVLILNNEFPPLGGGTGRVNFSLLKHLESRSELEFTVITSADETKSKGNIIRFSENTIIHYVEAGVKDNHHSTVFNLLSYAYKAYVLASKLHRENAFNRCSSWCTVPAGYIAYRLNSKFGIPYTVRISGPDIPYYESRYNLIYPFLKPFLNRTWQNSEKIIVKCSTERTALLKLGISDSKILTIPNGVDSNKFTPGSIIDHEPFVIVNVARLIGRKRQDILLRAVHGLVNEGYKIKLHLVGKGDAYEEYFNLTRELNLDDMVEFHGYVDHDSIGKIYQKAHAFVMTSENEGMSVAALEALACALPLIAPRDAGLDELVRNGENGFLYEKLNVEELKTKIKTLICDKASFKKFAATSLTMSKSFTWEEVAEKYLAVLNS